MSSCVLQCIPKYTGSKSTPRHIRPTKQSITSRQALPYTTWGLFWDNKTKNDKVIPTFLLNNFIVYEITENLYVQIFEGLPYLEIQLNQVRLKSTKWTIEQEHPKAFKI